MAAEKESSADWIKVQKKTFTRWCNSYLRRRGADEMLVKDLYVDLEDGLLLNSLLQIISNGGEVGADGRKFAFPHDKKKYKRPTMKIKKLEDVGQGLKFMKELGLRVTIEPNNLVQGSANYSERHIMGMIWMLILRYEVDIELDGVSGKSGLLRWCQRCTRDYEGVAVKNFGASWNNGKAFAALVHHHRPDLIDMSEFQDGASLDNLDRLFEIVEKELDIPRLIDAEDIADVAKPDEKVIIPYVAFLFKTFASYQKSEAYVKSVRRALQVRERESGPRDESRSTLHCEATLRSYIAKLAVGERVASLEYCTTEAYLYYYYYLTCDCGGPSDSSSD